MAIYSRICAILNSFEFAVGEENKDEAKEIKKERSYLN
jgi:hypothetical protein